MLLDAAQSFAAEFSLSYSRWQRVKAPSQRGPEREAGGAGVLRQATEEINKVLVEAYPQG